MKQQEALRVKEYLGKWVALDPTTNAVMGSGDTIREAQRAVKKTGSAEPVMYRVPESAAMFVG
jgi:hypothetical protein